MNTTTLTFDNFYARVLATTDISSQKELAQILGIDPAAITMAKNRKIPKSWVFKLSHHFGINPDWLMSGRGETYTRHQNQTILIPKVTALACAGGGSFEVTECVRARIRFDSSWLSSKGNPKSMVVMEVIGDSMSPELEPGDDILIDQSQKPLADNGIYVVSVGETIQVKRMQVRPGLILLFSSNQRFTPITLQGDEIDSFKVIGRVLWSSRTYA